ncbi:MAG: methionyl-tRNA formyltransferase [Actinobacteria bacterium]|nr:methionyl-tRNA formyltransferase [Actinomycetota bacterium]
MKVLFFGSSDFSVPFIDTIYKSKHPIVLAVTNPDAKTGRGKKIAPNPVKIQSLKLGIKYYELEKFDDFSIDFIKSNTFDIIVSVSYGKIIPPQLLDIAGIKTVNVHPSILPKYRGPSPIATALLNGEKITGISLIKIGKSLDTGDIYELKKIPVSVQDNYSTLEAKIINTATCMLKGFLDRFEKNNINSFSQRQSGISYTRIFTKKDTIIDWNESCLNIFNRIRAFASKPGAMSLFKGRTVKILKAKIYDSELAGKESIYSPGEVVCAEKTGLIIKCGKKGGGFIILELIQPQDKKIMSHQDFINGYRVKAGDLFE